MYIRRKYQYLARFILVKTTKDDDLLKKDTIWNKVCADIKKQFDCKPVYNNFL